MNVSQRQMFFVLISLLVVSISITGLSNLIASQPIEPDQQINPDVLPLSNIYLWLDIDGSQIKGESPIASLDREDTIEVYTLDLGMFLPVAAGSPTGKVTLDPIVMTKKIDISTPLLYDAAMRVSIVTKAEFRYYRPDPDLGIEQHYYTVIIEDAAITSIRTTTISQNPEYTITYDIDEVAFTVLGTLRLINEVAGTEMVYDASGPV